eukprot:3644199-Rhodomonas_salina.1
MELEGEGSAAKNGESREHMDKIEEGMSDASLRTPDGAKLAQGAANPLPGSDKDSESGARMDERAQIQSRLPFVPRRPFCLDAVSDEEKGLWVPKLRSVISQAARVSYDNLSLISNGDKPLEDGSGPMDGLDLSQI